MTEIITQIAKLPSKHVLFLLAALFSASALALFWPEHIVPMLRFVVFGLRDVAPIALPGIVLAAWIIASGADAHVARVFEGRGLQAIIYASLVGAITPVCGVTVLPMMAGLLAARVPLAPVMAFWLSSPVTDPAMLATTVATLGMSFAVGKTIAAFGLGILGGCVTSGLRRADWAQEPLRASGFVRELSGRACSKQRVFVAHVFTHGDRRADFWRQFWATTRLILWCLIPAFAAEYALNEALTPGSLAGYLGEESAFAIPAAVLVGAPAYIDGYAALPLTRSLLDNGMSPGAAMGFLVSGGVVSIWGAMAIAPVLKMKPFILYLMLAVGGSLIAAYAFEWVA